MAHTGHVRPDCPSEKLINLDTSDDNTTPDCTSEDVLNRAASDDDLLYGSSSESNKTRIASKHIEASAGTSDHTPSSKQPASMGEQQDDGLTSRQASNQPTTGTRSRAPNPFHQLFSPYGSSLSDQAGSRLADTQASKLRGLGTGPTLDFDWNRPRFIHDTPAALAETEITRRVKAESQTQFSIYQDKMEAKFVLKEGQFLSEIGRLQDYQKFENQEADNATDAQLDREKVKATSVWLGNDERHEFDEESDEATHQRHLNFANEARAEAEGDTEFLLQNQEIRHNHLRHSQIKTQRLQDDLNSAATAKLDAANAARSARRLPQDENPPSATIRARTSTAAARRANCNLQQDTAFLQRQKQSTPTLADTGPGFIRGTTGLSTINQQTYTHPAPTRDEDVPSSLRGGNSEGFRSRERNNQYRPIQTDTNQDLGASIAKALRTAAETSERALLAAMEAKTENVAKFAPEKGSVWKVWLSVFEGDAQERRWTDAQKLTRLRRALDGSAQEVYHHHQEGVTYSKLVHALGQR
jgi:hypothetical protein